MAGHYCGLQVIESLSQILLSIRQFLGLALLDGGHFSCGKGFGGSGLLLCHSLFFEVILEVVLEDNPAVEAFIHDQSGLGLSSKV